MQDIMDEIKNGSGMEELVAGVRGFIGAGTGAGGPADGGFKGISDLLGQEREKEPSVIDRIKEFLQGAFPEQGGAVGSIIEAFQWNADHPGTALPVAPYRDADGNYGVRISGDALAGHGWHRDEATGQLLPDASVIGGITGGISVGGSSGLPWTRRYPDGKAGRENAIQVMPDAKPYGKRFNIIAVPGVLTDGNGHFYDAHDLPDGMSWDGESKAPEVAEGYVVDPNGTCMTEEAAREKYGNSLVWGMQEDGTFINNLTGETWKYNQEAADIKGRRQAARDIDGKRPVLPLEREPSELPVGYGALDAPFIEVGSESGSRKIPKKWLTDLDPARAPDWKTFGGSMIGVDPLQPEARTQEKQAKAAPSKKAFGLPEVPVAKAAADGTEYGG